MRAQTSRRVCLGSTRCGGARRVTATIANSYGKSNADVGHSYDTGTDRRQSFVHVAQRGVVI